MGSRMAANLAAAGFELTVWNRTRETADAFAAEHAVRVAGTPREAAQSSEIVITMVVDGEQVESLLLQGAECAALGASPGTLFVDCSTIGPTHALRIAAALAQRGMTMLDAPVTGSSPRAQDGTLTFMVGGGARDFERARPLFETMGELIVHAGPLGHGQMVKVISNSVSARMPQLSARRLSSAPAPASTSTRWWTVMAAGSAWGSTMLNLKAGPMRSHDYTPLFKLDHMLKDVGLCLEEGQAAGVPFPSRR